MDDARLVPRSLRRGPDEGVVAAQRDRKAEADEQFYVNLSNAQNATIEDDTGLGTILNDDTSQLKRSQKSPAAAVDAVMEELLAGRNGKRRR